MELPKELVDKLERDKAREEKNLRKLKSQNEYKRRRLDKDVRKYIRDRGNRPYRSRDIERIGQRHGYHIGATLSRKD